MSKFILKLSDKNDRLVFEYPQEPYKSKIKQILSVCESKCNSYVSLDIKRPYKPRTTGIGSQNNLFWKLVTIIAEFCGDDSEGMSDTEYGIKMRALAKGYPFHISKLTGEKIPESTTKINTVEMSYLIDTAYQICAELGITVEKENIEEEFNTEEVVKQTFDELEIF